MSDTQILVVDDEVNMLRSVERVLAPHYEVQTAATPAEALEKAREHAPELAVLDIRMPDLDGFGLMSQLREVRPGLDVIFMTGAVHELDAQWIRAIREKAYYFIQKPFDREVLLTLVQRCLEQRRLAAQNREYVRRLESELAAARAFQQSLLPPPMARFDELEIAAHCLSCDELGGDLYDYFDCGEGRTTLLVADVSGHGVSAAMITGIVKSAAHEDGGDGDPLAIVERVNAALRPFDPGRFVTLFCARIDSVRGRLVFVNAGHPAPIVTRADGRSRLLPPTGSMLSPAFPEHDCTTYEIPFVPGDRLLVYTDGLTEARGADGLFGEERLRAVATSAAPDAAMAAAEEAESTTEATTARGDERGIGSATETGADWLARITAAVDAYRAGRPVDDDCTLLTARRLG